MNVSLFINILFFGSDRSPRRGDLVRPCVRVLLSSKEHAKGVLESLRRGPDASKQASRQVSKQASKQAGKKASRQARRQVGRQKGRKACNHYEGIQAEPCPGGACHTTKTMKD